MKKTLALLLAAILLCGALPAMAADDQYGYVNTETPVRMAASEKAVQQGTIAEGTKVLIQEELPDDGGMFTWYKISGVKNGETGYVKSDDVDMVIAKKSLVKAETTIKKGTLVTNEGDYPVLTASGIVDTLSLMTEDDLAQYTTLNVGDANDDTLKMKKRLYELGYITSEVTSNKFTEKIVTYIQAFQKVNGLTEDGVCSPELQARLYAASALNKKGKTVPVTDPVSITKASVKSKNGTYISFTVKNNTKSKIDAFNYFLIFYNTYGERYCFLESLTDELTLLVMSEERDTIAAKGTYTLQGTVVESVFLAGGLMCITGYHTEDGETVTFDDDQRHWYGFGKGVTTGYNEPIVTALTAGEQKRAQSWKMGVSGMYVDADYAKNYSVRQGFLVDTLTPGSAMDEAGLQSGDILLAVGDTRIFGSSSLARARAAIEPGQTVTVLYWRNGNVYVTTLTRPDGHENA